MSVEDRKQNPSLDLGTEDDWDKALSALEPEDPTAGERSDFDAEVDEADALLAVLLDETEPPDEVAAIEADIEPPATEPSGIAHSAALDFQPFESTDEVIVDVEDDEGDPEADMASETTEAVDSPPPPPQLLAPEVRQFSADEETQVIPADEVAPAADLTPALFATPSLALSPETAAAPEEPTHPPPPALPLDDERPASAHLAAADRLEAFLARSHFLEAEARSAQEPSARARGLLIAAELAGMAGDEARARELSLLAHEAAADHPLALRSLRAFALQEGDFEAALRLFDRESHGAETTSARAHASLFAAEIAREISADVSSYDERLDRALAAAPDDLRTLVMKRAAAIAEGNDVASLPWPAALPRPTESPAVSAFAKVRAAFHAGDAEAAVEALESLDAISGADTSAAFLGAAIAMSSAKTRAKALPLLEARLDGPSGSLARRWRARFALELGEAEVVEKSLVDPEAREFAPWERLALAALSSSTIDTIEPCLAEALGDSELWPLAAGVANALAEPELPARPEWTTGSPEAQARLRLARTLAARAPSEDLREAARTLEAGGGSAVGARLLAELDRKEGRFAELAEASADSSLGSGNERDRALFAGLLFELGGEVARAHAEYERARKLDPAFEAATRAALETANGASPLEALLEHEAALDDAERAAFILVEAALRAGSSPDAAERSAELLQHAKEKAPALPLTAWLSRDAASGDVPDHVEESLDPVERAHELFRRALAEDDRAKAAALLSEASRVRPSDITLREAYERLALETPPDRASYWEARAESATGAERARFALMACLEFERSGEKEAAIRLAELAVSAGESRFAPLVKARLSSGEASSDTPPEMLLPSDHPGHLASARRLEQRLIEEGREDELEPIFSAIAHALSDPEASSHAIVAARLRRRKAPSASVVDLARAALEVSPPSLFALRQLEGGVGDDREAMEAALALASRTTRPLERATLFLRAAEAAERAGEDARALELLDVALEAEPAHWVALGRLSSVAERQGEHERAALAYERLAEQSRVETHAVDAHLRAAQIWLERIDRPDRALASLGAAFALSPGHPGLFERLASLHRACGNDEALTRLLADRLETTPDDIEALCQLRELSQAREDWENLERSLLRLVEVTSDPEEQATLGLELGDLYRGPLSSFEKAEAAYLHVAERAPDGFSARERLVELYRSHGEGAKALALQEWLLEAAAASDEKKRRTLELARAHEELMGDPRRAEATLETLSKQFPTDPEVLEASVTLLRRASRHDDADARIAKVTSDARRSLATGRFDPALFSLLAKAATLRGKADAARVAEASFAAIEGRTIEIAGCGMEATDAEFADLLAPELLSPALRALLKRTGAALDAAAPFDLHVTASQPLSPEHAPLEAEIRKLAEGFGLAVEVYASPALGFSCIPAQSSPARLVLGTSLLTASDATVRRFLVLRALQVLATGGSALARTSPVDLFPLTVAYLQRITGGARPHGVDPSKVDGFAEKIAPGLAGMVDDELRAMALEVSDALGHRASSLHTALHGFGNRTALLAIGDPTAGLTAIAWASGDPAALPPSGRERVSWIGRNAEARDLVVFSVGDEYARARAMLAEPDIPVDMF